MIKINRTFKKQFFFSILDLVLNLYLYKDCIIIVGVGFIVALFYLS